MKNILLLLLILSTFELSAQKKKEEDVVISNATISYYLPKLSYKITVETEQTVHTPGPYSKEANKMLGITPEITQVQEKWVIKSINLEPIYIPDPASHFTVNTTGYSNSINIGLSPEGLLAVVSTNNKQQVSNNQNIHYTFTNTSNPSSANINDIAGYSSAKEVLDTNYSDVEVDGEIRKVWDPIISYAAKTEADNVKEAADELFRIRTEYSKLFDTDNNVIDGEALQVLLKELKAREAEYLSLFLGTSETHTIKKTFYYTPQKANTQELIFRFSEYYGFTEATEKEAQAYTAQATNVILTTPQVTNASTDNANIIYRLPANAEVQLYQGSELYTKFRATIPQLGTYATFPLDLIKAKNLSLEFYPEYGSLKNVGNN